MAERESLDLTRLHDDASNRFLTDGNLGIGYPRDKGQGTIHVPIGGGSVAVYYTPYSYATNGKYVAGNPLVEYRGIEA